MNLRIHIIALVLSGLLGGAAGILSLHGAQAATTYNLHINPGGAVSSMSCGWHDVCTPGFPDAILNGLDWDNAANDSVYWRSYGQRSGSSGSVGTVLASYISVGGCKRINAQVRDVNMTTRGTVEYKHTDTPTTTFFGINGDLFGTAYTQATLGKTIQTWEENAGCTILGDHLHQESASWIRNTSTYANEPATGSYSPSSQSNWMFRGTWILP